MKDRKYSETITVHKASELAKQPKQTKKKQPKKDK